MTSYESNATETSHQTCRSACDTHSSYTWRCLFFFSLYEWTNPANYRFLQLGCAQSLKVLSSASSHFIILLFFSTLSCCCLSHMHCFLTVFNVWLLLSFIMRAYFIVFCKTVFNVWCDTWIFPIGSNKVSIYLNSSKKKKGRGRICDDSNTKKKIITHN